MKPKTIEFDSSKQSISDLIDEIANSIKESFDKSKSDIFKDMIADTKLFVDWAKDYNEVTIYFIKILLLLLITLKTFVCENVKDDIREIIDKRTKSSYKPTKEDLNKLRKEDLINMIINEEEPKKNQN